MGDEMVLDVGCGTGTFLKIIKSRYPGIKAIGIDPDPKVLEIARNKLSGVETELHQAFAESTTLPSDSIDICFSTLAFHHMPDEIKLKAIIEIRRVLKNGGRFILADFGKTKAPLIFFLFEELEYLKGNLRGLIPEYLERTGFREVKTVFKRFLGIESLSCYK